MSVGGATAARIDMGRDQPTQPGAVAARHRNLAGSTGTPEVPGNLLAKLNRILFVREASQRGRPLRIAGELRTHRTHPLRVSSRIEEVSPIQGLDELLNLLRRQDFAEAPRKCRLKIERLVITIHLSDKEIGTHPDEDRLGRYTGRIAQQNESLALLLDGQCFHRSDLRLFHHFRGYDP